MKELPKKLAIKNDRIFLFLDFDGTISNIVPHPAHAEIMPEAKAWLAQLIGTGKVKIAIVTGRALADIRKRVGLRDIFYVANHGLEIWHRSRFILNKGASYKRPITSFARLLHERLSHFKNVFIENKGLSVAVHYRRVPKALHKELRSLVVSLAEPYISRHGLDITLGKMLMELRPSSYWNKGKAVRFLWKKAGRSNFPIYIGDDITDEDAFEALKADGLTIRIGRKKGSAAKYYVSGIKGLMEILNPKHPCSRARPNGHRGGRSRPRVQ